MEEHVTILGALYIAFNALGIVIACIIFAVLSSSGLISGDAEAIAITSAVGFFVAVIIIIFCAPGLIAGIGLLKHYAWARILTLILGCLNLISVPFGTILGVYTIWVLLKEETEQLFTRDTESSTTRDDLQV